MVRAASTTPRTLVRESARTLHHHPSAPAFELASEEESPSQPNEAVEVRRGLGSTGSSGFAIGASGTAYSFFISISDDIIEHKNGDSGWTLLSYRFSPKV
jgi:hypothetical protein